MAVISLPCFAETAGAVEGHTTTKYNSAVRIAVRCPSLEHPDSEGKLKSGHIMYKSIAVFVGRT